MAQNVTCTRRIKWDAMHRIPDHEGACRAFHGHRYVAEITCASQGGNDDGMVIDFGIVKEIVGDWICENFDHTAILDRGDGDPAIELIRTCNAAAGKPIYLMDGPPTAENIASEIALISQRLLEPYRITVTRVIVWETPNCHATWVAANGAQ